MPFPATARATSAAISATAVVAVAALAALASGCASTASNVTARGSATQPTVRIGPLTPKDPARVPAAEAAAIASLGAVADRRTPAWFGADAATASAAHAHTHGGPASVLPLTSNERRTLDEQWSRAAAAATTVATEEQAAALGYVRAAADGAGVGVHWVKWSLVDRPFDPAQPAMLLFDERREPARLAGYSYWLRSATEPAGFAGPNDTWHQHAGLCVVNGWVDREEAAGPEACAGTYLGGRDLWMMHAWPVPGAPNRWGDFATLNPALCPRAAGTPDIARCPDKFSIADR